MLKQPEYKWPVSNNSRYRRYDAGKSEEMDALDYALELMTKNEGFRDGVYYDSVGKKYTAGYGFTDKKDLHDWTEPQARARLKEMASQYHNALSNGRVAETYSQLTPRQQAAMIDLLHQGGMGVLTKMPKFTKYLQEGDLQHAYDEFTWGRINGAGTRNRDDRRRSYFSPTINAEEYAKQKALESQTMPIDALRVNRTIPVKDPNSDVRRAAAWQDMLETNKALKNIYAMRDLLIPVPIAKIPSLEDAVFKLNAPVWQSK